MKNKNHKTRENATTVHLEPKKPTKRMTKNKTRHKNLAHFARKEGTRLASAQLLRTCPSRNDGTMSKRKGCAACASQKITEQTVANSVHVTSMGAKESTLDGCTRKRKKKKYMVPTLHRTKLTTKKTKVIQAWLQSLR